MKRILYTIPLTLVFLLSACEWEQLPEINVNPNQATTPKTSALLTNVQTQMGGLMISTTGALYAQHLSNKQYTSGDNYITINFSTDGFYSGPLMDLKQIIEMNSNEETAESVGVDGSNNNQIAIAKILTAWYYLHMTDRWGDLPLTEALNGQDGLLKPKFDSQESIYDNCFAMLKEANAMMDNGAAINGDILFDGDMDMWRKFANTIRLNAALRISEANPGKAQTEFASAFNDGVIALDNSENIRYNYLSVQSYENPYYNSFVTAGRADWTIADPLMNLMQIDTYASPHRDSYADGHPYKTETGKMDVVADPRLPVYANPIENTTDTYIGMPYGLSEAAAGAVPAEEVSFMGDGLREQNTPAYIFTASQVAFILAEGRLNNWITTGTAQGYYEQGIQASLDQHGVGEGFAQYITNSEVAFDPARALEQIITQKWIAIFPNGYEAWAEWRRTGFPDLAPGQNARTPNNQIPRRQAYGTSEASLNKENHTAALAAQGFAADDLTGRVWWDKP